MDQRCSLQLDLTLFVCLFVSTHVRALTAYLWGTQLATPSPASRRSCPTPSPLYLFSPCPFLLFSPSFAPHPPWPCHLCVGCHSFSTNCFPAGWSRGLRWRKSRNEKGKEPRQRVESDLQVRNLQTNQVFTLSIGTIPWVIVRQGCLHLFTLPARAQMEGWMGRRPATSVLDSLCLCVCFSLGEHFPAPWRV